MFLPLSGLREASSLFCIVCCIYNLYFLYCSLLLPRAKVVKRSTYFFYLVEYSQRFERLTRSVTYFYTFDAVIMLPRGRIHS